MPNLPACLASLAQELNLHRHFLRERGATALDPGFPRLPGRARTSHDEFIAAHQDAIQRLLLQGGFPEPGLLEALARHLGSGAAVPAQHPTARHLQCLRRVLARRAWLGLHLKPRHGKESHPRPPV